MSRLRSVDWLAVWFYGMSVPLYLSFFYAPHMFPWLLAVKYIPFGWYWHYTRG